MFAPSMRNATSVDSSSFLLHSLQVLDISSTSSRQTNHELPTKKPGALLGQAPLRRPSPQSSQRYLPPPVRSMDGATLHACAGYEMESYCHGDRHRICLPHYRLVLR